MLAFRVYYVQCLLKQQSTLNRAIVHHNIDTPSCNTCTRPMQELACHMTLIAKDTNKCADHGNKSAVQAASVVLMNPR